MKNLGAKGVFEWLVSNPANGKKAQFQLIEDPYVKIKGNVPVESLTLPQGYYPNPQGKISNRKNVPKGEAYDTITYECDVQYFVNQARERADKARKEKNPLLKEIHFGKKGGKK